MAKECVEWMSVSSSNYYLSLLVARPAWQDPCNLLSLTEWLALAYCRPLSDPGLTAPLSSEFESPEAQSPQTRMPTRPDSLA